MVCPSSHSESGREPRNSDFQAVGCYCSDLLLKSFLHPQKDITHFSLSSSSLDAIVNVVTFLAMEPSLWGQERLLKATCFKQSFRLRWLIALVRTDPPTTLCRRACIIWLVKEDFWCISSGDCFPWKKRQTCFPGWGVEKFPLLKSAQLGVDAGL